MGFKEKEVLLNSFVLSNFISCPLVWDFCSSKSLKKIEKIQERVLRIHVTTLPVIIINFETKQVKPLSMEVKRLSNFSLKISKTLNHLNLEYMKEIFHKTTNLTHTLFNIKANQNDTTKYGNKTLRNLGSHIWDSLPKQIKEETDYNKFENFIDKWFGAKFMFLFKLKI